MDRKTIEECLRYDGESGVFFWKNGRRAGCLRKDGYVVIRLLGVLYYAHRLAWIIAYGSEPHGVIDHISGVKDDNRIANLRDTDTRINAQNVKRVVKPENYSGYRGVQRNGTGWQAVIRDHGIRHCLGTYKTEHEAHQRYIEAKLSMHEGYVPSATTTAPAPQR